MDPHVRRIIDANANRAREGLRVLEEHARFALEDARLTERIKRCRHELRAVLNAWSPARCLAGRDTEADVGRAISTEAERVRADAGEVATAAAKRAAEALRCLEEYGKIDHPDVAPQFERLRYQVYEIEQQIGVAGPLRARLRSARLHVLVTERLCREPWLDVCRAAIDGGATVLQLREKELPDGEMLERARRLRELTAAQGALFVVNDRPHIARLAEADGLHVGQDDLSVAEARRIAGPTVLVGKSTHSVSQVRAAIEERPDYIAVGPMFPSATKPESVVAGPELLAAAQGLADVPIVAIGGVTAGRIAELDLRSTDQAAVCAEVLGASDPADAVRRIVAAIKTRIDMTRADGTR